VRTLFDDPPAQSHSDTSVAAAQAIKPNANRLRMLVLEAIRAAGADGLTDEEGIAATQLSPSTYRPRRIESVQAGLVVDSGRTRKTASGRSAVVWFSTTHEGNA
jgi:hypothetical protein